MANEYLKDEFIYIDVLTYAGNLETQELIMTSLTLSLFMKIFVIYMPYSIYLKKKFDYVINFAFESHVDRSIENPGIFLQTNIIDTQTLMDACRK